MSDREECTGMTFRDGVAPNEGRRRCRALLETVGDGLFQLGPDCRFVAVNDALVEMTGYGSDELLDEPVATVLATDGEAIEREVERLLTGTAGERALLECPIRTADGKRVRCSVRVTAFGTENPHKGVVGTVREAVDRSRTEFDWHERDRNADSETAGHRGIHELRQSEERLRLALEAGDLGIWELDLQTRDSPIRSLQHDRIFGYEEPYTDWNFDVFLEHVHPDDRAVVERTFEEAFRTGTWTFDCRIERVDGEQRWIEAQGEFYYDADDEPVRAVGIIKDITEQKETEEYLEDVTSQLEAATEAGAVGTWEWHVEEDRLVAGPSFADLFGIDPDAARGGVPIERFVSSIHEDDRERVEREIDAAIESCGGYEVEYRVRNADGEFRWVVARGHVECDEDGAPTTFPGALTDITERKRAELEAERQSNQLETLFQVLPVGAVVADGDGALIRANDTAKEIWGGDVFDAESIKEYEKFTAVWTDTGEPVDPDEWTMSRVLDGESVTEPNVYEITAFDGERRVIMEHGKPVRDADGAVSRAIVTLTDITERKTYERRLEASNERLKQFAYAASHDLREPLRMVISYLELLERRYSDELDSDAEEFIEFAVDGADRMREMIDGLLDYARVDTQGEPFEPVDLNELLEEVQDSLRVKIDESGAEITTEPLPHVRGDPAQLRQLLQNLLSNAIEYSGDEPPQIHVGADRTESDEPVISVCDEGIGIDPDDQARIFEVFQRLHGHGEHPGTGIGLALCQRIVRRHGGEIRVESEPGEGATFSFTIDGTADAERDDGDTE